MPAKKSATPTSARRPGGAVAPPAQQRRKQAAASAPRGAKSAPLPETPRFTRDKILGYGAAAGMLLSLVGLNISSIVLLIGLAYVSAAFLRLPERRDWRLRQAAWAFTAIGALATLAFSTLLGAGSVDKTLGEVSLFTYLPLGRASVVLGAAGAAVLALAAILASLAFGRQADQRYRRLSQSAVCVVFYFVSTLPTTVAQSAAPEALGSFWSTPLTYLYAVLGILAAGVIACAFLWASTPEHTPGTSGRFGYAEREYLLFVGAVSLLLPRLTGLIVFDWSPLQRVADETQGEAALRAASAVSWLLLMIVLSAAAAVAFWISCRKAGWKPSRWLAAPDGAAPDDAALGATPEQRVPLAWVKKFLLSWRLPLFYGWLLALVAACTLLGWYGFLAATPAAVHYVWMLVRDHQNERQTSTM